MGIIDILETWRVKKQAEHWTKVICQCLCYGRQRMEISAIAPIPYANRFVKAMARHLGVALACDPDMTDICPLKFAGERDSVKMSGPAAYRMSVSLRHDDDY